MSIPTATLDPEVVHLLAEVVADPRSCLNRAPRKPVAQWVVRREGPVSASEPFMSRAERHLIRVHREEVAHLLYQECQRAVLRGSIGPHLVQRISPECRVCLPSKDLWSRRARRLRNTALFETNREVFSLQSNNRPLKTETALQFASASLRLVPRDSTRIWLGLAMLQLSWAHSALQVFGDVLKNSTVQLYRALAHLDSGLACLTLGQLRESRNHYRASAHTHQEFLPGQTSWMTTALWLADRRDFLKAADGMKDYGDEVAASASQFETALQPSNWLIGFSEEGTRMFAETADRIPDIARRILDGII